MKQGPPLRRKAPLGAQQAALERRAPLRQGVKGLKPHATVREPESNGRQKPDWLDEALALHADGASYAQIAERVGVSHNSVYYRLNIRRRGTSRVCPTCGDEFLTYDMRSKFCSRACWAGREVSVQQRERQSATMRGTRKGPENPNYRHGKRVGVKERALRFKSGATTCQSPDCKRQRGVLHEHHVIYEQHVKKYGGDPYDPANALTLCAGCHSHHHSRTKPIALAALRTENYTFAAELLGAPAAYEYLARRYGGDDPRLIAFLEAS